MSGAKNSAFLSVSIATAFLTIAAPSPARSQDLRSSVQAVTAGRVQDSVTSPSYSVRAAIEREAARLAEAGVRRTTWQQPVPLERNRVDRHRAAAGTLIGAATGTTWQQQAVQQERSWVGRHPALTGALIGAGVGATYAYILCRGQCEGQPGLYMMLFGGIGAGIGAGTGAIVGALRD
jgi:hypothetical protein